MGTDTVCVPIPEVDPWRLSCYFGGVKFLRALTNSLLSGLFFSLLLSLLVADLNINLGFKLGAQGKLTLFLMASYGLLVAVLCLLLSSFFLFFTGKRVDGGFVSTSFLMTSFSLLTLVFLVIFRENYTHFLSFFVPGVRSLLRAQMLALFVLAVAGLVIRRQIRQGKPRRLYVRAYFVLAAVVLIFVFWMRVNYPSPQRSFKLVNLEVKKIDKKVTILRLEGLSLDFILPLANERKLPNFMWLMDHGCWGHLRGFTPSDPFVLHRSFDTGMLPGKHRQISEVRYAIPGMKETLEVVPRFILFRQLTRAGLLVMLPNEAPSSVKDIWKIFEDCGAVTLKRESSSIAPSPSKPGPKIDKLFGTFYKDFQFEAALIFSQVKQAFFRDADLQDRALAEKTDLQPQLFSLGLDGANIAEMFFYRFSFPEAFGEIQQQLQKYGTVIEKYYQFYDQIIGSYLATLKEGELFIVYSPYGVEPLPFWKRVLEWMLGNGNVTSYHERAPEGAVFVYGKGIVRGINVDAIRLVDLAPAILYYMGLPVAKDMDGVVLGSLFEREFTDENPLFTISSYEEVNIKK